jgi:prevent-host-death family protein
MEITAADLRSNFFKILDLIAKKHIEVVITKRGKPIAKLVRYEKVDRSDLMLGTLPNVGTTVDDLTKPFNEGWQLD